MTLFLFVYACLWAATKIAADASIGTTTFFGHVKTTFVGFLWPVFIPSLIVFILLEKALCY